MKLSNAVRFLTLAVALSALLPAIASAEDTKGKWQFGFGLSYFSTTDYIRSNADLALSSGVVDESGLPSVFSVDERPDANIQNEPTIHDDFKVDLNASYGLTRWLAVEMALSYYKSQVGSIEYYSQDKFKGVDATGSRATYLGCGPDPAGWGPSDVAGQLSPGQCYDFRPDPTESEQRTNSFVPVGELTQIPLHLSGLIRFRPESPFDPYIGLGIGYIFTNMQNGREFSDLSSRLGSLNVVTAHEGEFTAETCSPATDPGCKVVPSPGFVPTAPEVTVENSLGWHAIAGADYYVNERFSFFVDARYVWTNGSVDIRTDGAHQVRFGVEDYGRLLLDQVGSKGDPSQYYLWEDTGFFYYDSIAQRFVEVPCDEADPMRCTGDGFFETEDRFVNGQLDRGLGEDDGTIYKVAPGPYIGSNGQWDLIGEAVEVFTCDACKGNGRLDTEDRNFNQMLDRFLSYGIDRCSLPTTDPRYSPEICTRVSRPATIQYVWPAGCPNSPEQLQGDQKGQHEGCPPVPGSEGNPGSVSTSSGGDDTTDLHLLQGGTIRLGGFSIGVGFKFTF